MQCPDPKTPGEHILMVPSPQERTPRNGTPPTSKPGNVLDVPATGEIELPVTLTESAQRDRDDGQDVSS